MRRFAVTVIAIIVSYVFIYGVSSVTKINGWWFSLIVCFALEYPIIYLCRPTHIEEQIIRKEYIIDLYDNKIGDLFVASEYPNYKKMNSGTEGNDYMSDTGSVICTKFVNKRNLISVKENSISIHLYCFFICLFSFLLWNALADSLSLKNNYNSHMNIVIKNILELKSNGFRKILDNTGRNFEGIITNIKELWNSIRANISKNFKFPFDLKLMSSGWNEVWTRFAKNIAKFFEDIKSIF